MLLKISHILENQKNVLICSLHCFIFLVNVKSASISNILAIILRILDKGIVKLYICWTAYGSGAGKMMPIWPNPDPDPQHPFDQAYFMTIISFLWPY